MYDLIIYALNLQTLIKILTLQIKLVRNILTNKKIKIYPLRSVQRGIREIKNIYLIVRYFQNAFYFHVYKIGKVIFSQADQLP